MREARLVDGKGNKKETDRQIEREGKRRETEERERWRRTWAEGRAGELQRQREKLMSRVCQPPTSIIYVQAVDAGKGEGVLVHGIVRTHAPPPCL